MTITRRGLFGLLAGAPVAIRSALTLPVRIAAPLAAAPAVAPAATFDARCIAAAAVIAAAFCTLGVLLPGETPRHDDMKAALGVLNKELGKWPALSRHFWGTARPPVMQLGSPVPLQAAGLLIYSLAWDLAPLYGAPLAAFGPPSRIAS